MYHYHITVCDGNSVYHYHITVCVASDFHTTTPRSLECVTVGEGNSSWHTLQMVTCLELHLSL